jgi:hypothetical protein
VPSIKAHAPEEKGGGMRCFHNYTSFVKINPCRGVVDDYKVRDKIGGVIA